MVTGPTEPPQPKLRALDIRRINHDSTPYLLMRDPLALNTDQMIVPEALGPLLALCDGTRDAARLKADLQKRTGIVISLEQMGLLITQFSEGLLLQDTRYAEALNQATQQYRNAPFRPPALAGKVYPKDPTELAATLGRYCTDAKVQKAQPSNEDVIGIISPHIDYERGWQTYAGVWQEAASAVRTSDIAIIFGTDHSGGPGRLTLTHQHYATPWGAVPTSKSIVDALAKELGDEAYAEEIHHRSEHSIELALIWLHYFLGSHPCEIVPILCGSFHEFVIGQQSPSSFLPFKTALDVLQRMTAGKRTLIVAAADLAHVGPAFGDQSLYRQPEKDALRYSDHRLLNAVARADHEDFFKNIKNVGDQYRICGMPPIYLTLRMLAEATGRTTGYDQCPADDEDSSFVSVAGVLLQRKRV